MPERIEPQIFNPEQIAEILWVGRETVYRWMAEDKVPWIELKDSEGEYALPFQGVLCSLDGIYDLHAETEQLFADVTERPPEN